MKKFFNKVQNKANELAIIRDRRREVVVLILLSPPIRYIGLNSKELTFSLPYRLIHRLIPILRDLICKKKFIEIYMGCDGEFDTYAATLVKRVQNDYD